MKSVSSISKEDCCGCLACLDKCPVNAISTQVIDGFTFPSVDAEKCISCGKCLSVCNFYEHPPKNELSKAFISVSKDISIYKNGSSGGIFGTIAKYIIDSKNGVIVGAAIIENCEAKHILIDSKEELPLLQGSKYVQSDCKNIYIRIQELLEGGRFVLFSGTPCQVAALRKFLGQEYDNLLCVDIVCHGVPSPFYLKYHINNQYTANKVEKLFFRTKDKYERYGFNLKIETNEKSFFVSGNEDLYYRLFLKELSFRESCYRCPYACRERVGDLTIGDCGNSKKYMDFHSDMTISTVYPVTEKGFKLWNEVKDSLYYREADLESEIAANAQLNHPAIRKDFRDNLYRGNDYYETERNALSYLGAPSIKIRIKERLKRVIPERYRRLLIGIIKNADDYSKR